MDSKYHHSKSLQGFTLIEMLVVIMIIVLLMGLGVGGWLSLAERNASLATQELLSSIIQQARNRSISQARRVVIHINQADGSITGIDQDFLWREHFDWPIADFSSYIDGASDSPYVTPSERSLGHTGYAWKYPYAAPGSGSQVFLAPFNTTKVGYDSGTGEDIHMPLFKTADDGFLLECSIKAPDVESAQRTQIPLLLLSPKEENSDLVDDAIGALELWKVSTYIANPEPAPDPMVPSYQAFIKTGHVWTLIAWMGERPSYPVFNATNPEDVTDWDFIQNGISGSAIFTRAWNNVENEVIPYTGNTWLKVGLAFDNNSIFLFMDNKRVDDAALTFTPTLDEEVSIYVGRHSIAVGTNEVRYVSEAMIDNCALVSIGSSGQQFVPGNIIPKYNYKIICENGRVSCLEQNPTSLSYTERQQISFVSKDTAIDNFAIHISSDGNLSSTLYTTQDLTGVAPE